jgi:hypothetical protein
MIQSKPESIKQIRERIRKMSDAELRKYGRAAQDSSDPKKNFGPRNPAFQVQLDEARAEWRRRHPAGAGRRSPRMPDLSGRRPREQSGLTSACPACEIIASIRVRLFR